MRCAPGARSQEKKKMSGAKLEGGLVPAMIGGQRAATVP